MLSGFCNQYGVETPSENSIAEMIQLIKLNHAIVSVAKFQQKFSQQMEIVIAEKAKNEAALIISENRNKTLPDLIDSRRDSLPLRRKIIFQNVAHGSSLVGGIPTAIAGGVVGGALAGMAVGFDSGIKWIEEKAGKISLGIKRIKNKHQPQV